MKTSPFINFAAACLLLTALASNRLPAQTVPPLINYQGKLVSSNGLPVSTADYKLSFRIWDAVTGGNLVWGPQVFNGQSGPGYGKLVSVGQGWFNVILGPTDTNGILIANAFNGTNRFVEIQLASDPPFAPRQQILSAPFALVAGTVPDRSITTAKIANGAIGSNQLASQAVQIGNIANAAVGTSQLALQAVQTANIANGAVGAAQLAPGAFGFVPRNIQVFTSSGTWTKPADVSKVYVKVIGRGGNGGNATDSRPRGGGGGGGYAEGLIAVTGNATITIGAINSFAGSSTIQATSGGNASGQAGGPGGVGSGGLINLTGGAGQSVSETVNGTGGIGGSTPLGAGGSGAGLVGGVTYLPAGNGASFGGGGGGATNEPRNGGIGDAGAVIVYY